jgi:hypothetical protein
MAKTSFGFPYLEHGTIALESITKGADAYIAFQSPVPKKSRADVMRGCPTPIGGMWSWGPNLVSMSSMGDTFDYEIAEQYAGGDMDAIDDAAAAKFFADVEAWVKGVHAKFPIAFFLGPCAVDVSPWGRWTQEVLPGIMIPFLEKYAEANAKDVGKSFDDRDPEDGVFDNDSMCCILQRVPDTGDKDLQRRTKALRKKFPI